MFKDTANVKENLQNTNNPTIRLFVNSFRLRMRLKTLFYNAIYIYLISAMQWDSS